MSLISFIDSPSPSTSYASIPDERRVSDDVVMTNTSKIKKRRSKSVLDELRRGEERRHSLVDGSVDYKFCLFIYSRERNTCHRVTISHILSCCYR